jgi:hypothetical protein
MKYTIFTFAGLSALYFKSTYLAGRPCFVKKNINQNTGKIHYEWYEQQCNLLSSIILETRHLTLRMQGIVHHQPNYRELE